MTNDKVLELLGEVVHPEYGKSIVELEMVDSLKVSPSAVSFTLILKKSKDPFATKLKRYASDLIGNAYPSIKDNILIVLKEPVKSKKESVKPSSHNTISKIIAISSCKGGVGKSTVTANLAATLALEGYSVGVIDADVYGPSMPIMFDVEDYTPVSESDQPNALIVPAQRHGVKVMSIGFFIKPSDALVWRGPMATSALKQLIHQTQWGELDYLLIDLPPGTGDIHLTTLAELKVDGAIIVSTPHKLAIADVVRGIEMFRSQHVNIKVLGLIENMSWFSPKENPESRYYIFGKDACRELSQQMDIPLLGQIPVIAAQNENVEDKHLKVFEDNETLRIFHEIAKTVL